MTLNRLIFLTVIILSSTSIFAKNSHWHFSLGIGQSNSWKIKNERFNNELADFMRNNPTADEPIISSYSLGVFLHKYSNITLGVEIDGDDYIQRINTDNQIELGVIRGNAVFHYFPWGNTTKGLYAGAGVGLHHISAVKHIEGIGDDIIHSTYGYGYKASIGVITPVYSWFGIKLQANYNQSFNSADVNTWISYLLHFTYTAQ